MLKEVTTKALKEYQRESTRESMLWWNVGIFSILSAAWIWKAETPLDYAIAGLMIIGIVLTIRTRQK